MKLKSLACAALMVIATTVAPDLALAQGSVVRPLVRDLVEALSSSAARQTGRTAAQEMEKVGGEEAVKALTTRILREGGEAALDNASVLVRRFGVDALEAMMRASNVPKLQHAIAELPEEMAGKAVRALARGDEGQTLARAAEQLGSPVLRLEVQHPGVGGAIARELGTDGIDAASRLSTDQAIVLTRHASEIAKLPAKQKQNFLQLVEKRGTEVIGFAERHPKVLFTAATVGVILAEPDRILGGSDVIIDENGQPRVVARPGLVERLVSSLLGTPILMLSVVAALGAAAWFGVRLYFLYQHRKLERDRRKPGGLHAARWKGRRA